MRNHIMYLWIFLVCGASFCAEKPNVVRADIDRYTQVNKYTLSTEHTLTGPGDVISNYSKGVRKMFVKYFRKVKEDHLMRDEVHLEARLFPDDPQVSDKMIILVNDQPTNFNNVRWTLEKKTEPSRYLLASYIFSPSDQMKRNMRLADSMGIRIYLGSEPATVTYDAMALQAVRKFYSQATDEEWRH